MTLRNGIPVAPRLLSDNIPQVDLVEGLEPPQALLRPFRMRQHDVADRQERKLVHVIAIAIGFHQGSKKQREVPLPISPVDRVKGSAGSGLPCAGLSIGGKDFNA